MTRAWILLLGAAISASCAPTVDEYAVSLAACEVGGSGYGSGYPCVDAGAGSGGDAGSGSDAGSDAGTDAGGDGGGGDGGDGGGGDGGGGGGGDGGGDGGSGPPDGGPPPDGGTPDGGAPDAGTPDAGTPDAGTPDAGTPDGGTPDAGTPDAGTPDGPPPDGPLQCEGEAPPLLALPNFNRRFELKGKDSFDNEIKLGAEVRLEGDNDSSECEAKSSASLFGYVLVKVLGQEGGFSFSGNGSQHRCATKECTDPPNYSCGGASCNSMTAGGSFAGYRGVEIDICKKYAGKFGWIGRKLCSVAEVKASGRLGLGATAVIELTDGVPTGSCATCCADGRSRSSLEAGPAGLVEGKASAKFKLWKFEIEVGVGAKGCASLTGKVGSDCDGNAFPDGDLHGYAAVCIESMISPGGSYRILNNEAELCLPLGFWTFCTWFPRCWKTPTDPARACPSGSPNPE